ncbi:hypothetical protein TCAL_04344 [Tigriopus californicus]|uniref:Uncharacterized protein n=1 Tax=Tigriopus californicus TaxID=6832 RepID=A0A553PSS5_TIGCA|nr:uncharacterized protein LOC131892412 [Tigriopus californicus]TRY80733.1 hypothetical protein TCAL_04344 [Tigriopus californicus]|eukprot:TCALIF_04344-PA protein Name:"Protein of unknown function" AED:0.00 eAED:0.00 QI:24/1/1/1/0.66/0.5/4/120/176
MVTSKLLFASCLLAAACKAIYLEETPATEEDVVEDPSPPEVYFRPSFPRLHFSSINGFGDDPISPFRNFLLTNPAAGGMDETNRVLKFKEQLEKLKKYLCSNFYTLTCHTIRHYQMQVGQHEQDLLRRQQESRRLMQRSFGPISHASTKRQGPTRPNRGPEEPASLPRMAKWEWQV